MTIGFAKDIHLLQENNQKPLILAGVTIKDSKFSVKAHSDGDLVLHAITSAILGALGLKTIGEYFSDTDPQNKDRSSVDFLNFALEELKKHTMRIQSLDLTIICEQIMLKDHLEAFRKSLKDLIGYDLPIGLKATRFEDKNNQYIECYCALIVETIY